MNFRIAGLILFPILLTSCGRGIANTVIPNTLTVTPSKTAISTSTLVPTSTVTPFPPLSGNPPYLMLRDVQSLFLYDNDGRGRQIIQLPLDGHVFSPLKTIVSPDGQWLVFYTGSIGNTGYDEKLPVTLNLINLTDGTIRKVADIVTDGYQQKLEEVAINLKMLFPDFYKPLDDRDWVSSSVISEFTWRIYSVAWSPDGQYLAFAGQIDGLSSDVYLYDIGSNTIQRVNDDLQSVYGIEWSPDGKYIVFENSHPGYVYTGSSLYAVMPSEKTVKDPRPLQYSTWWSIKGWLSSDQLLISEGTDTAGDLDLKILNINNGQFKHLWEDSFGDYSIDNINQVILLNSSDFTEDEYMGIYFVGFDGEKEKILDGLYYFDLIFRGEKKHRFLASGVSIFAENKINGVVGVAFDGTITLLSQIRDRKIRISPDYAWMTIYNDEEINLYDQHDELVRTFPLPNVYQVLWHPDSKGIFYSSGKELYYLSVPNGEPLIIDQCLSEYCRFGFSVDDSIWLP